MHLPMSQNSSLFSPIWRILCICLIIMAYFVRQLKPEKRWTKWILEYLLKYIRAVFYFIRPFNRRHNYMDDSVIKKMPSRKQIVAFSNNTEHLWPTAGFILQNHLNTYQVFFCVAVTDTLYALHAPFIFRTLIRSL